MKDAFKDAVIACDRLLATSCARPHRVHPQGMCLARCSMAHYRKKPLPPMHLG